MFSFCSTQDQEVSHLFVDSLFCALILVIILDSLMLDIEFGRQSLKKTMTSLPSPVHFKPNLLLSGI